MTNKYLITKDYVKLYVYSKKCGLKVILLDIDELEKVKLHEWFTMKNGNTTYVFTTINKYLLGMHRYILNLQKNDKNYVDHVNHNGLDNRKENLRICNNMLNQQNRKVNKQSKSGVIGVNWHPDGYWMARIKVNQKNINLGYFKNKKDAIVSRKIAELRYFTRIK